MDRWRFAPRNRAWLIVWCQDIWIPAPFSTSFPCSLQPFSCCICVFGWFVMSQTLALDTKKKKVVSQGPTGNEFHLNLPQTQTDKQPRSGAFHESRILPRWQSDGVNKKKPLMMFLFSPVSAQMRSRHGRKATQGIRMWWLWKNIYNEPNYFDLHD